MNFHHLLHFGTDKAFYCTVAFSLLLFVQMAGEKFTANGATRASETLPFFFLFLQCRFSVYSRAVPLCFLFVTLPSYANQVWAKIKQIGHDVACPKIALECFWEALTCTRRNTGCTLSVVLGFIFQVKCEIYGKSCSYISVDMFVYQSVVFLSI